MGTNRGAGHARARGSPRKVKFPAASFPISSLNFFRDLSRASVQNVRRMTFREISAALPKHAVTSIDRLPFPRIASGKVREIFDLGDALLLTASDRLSAFDVILPDRIPGKGATLTQIG